MYLLQEISICNLKIILNFVGMLSHQLKRHVIDGEKAIIQNPSEAQRYSTVKIVLKQKNI